MSSAVFQHQMVVGVGTALTSAILSAVIVFFLLVMRQRLHDKQLMLRLVQYSFVGPFSNMDYKSHTGHFCMI